jgi:Ca2+-binding EF-hand superfamily protein
MGLSFSLSLNAESRNSLSATADKSKRVVEDERLGEDDSRVDGYQKTLNLNFSPERREMLRKALEEYARSIDPSHDQIEERRRAMQESIEARFFEADTDNNSTIDRQEATEKLPQIARHFNSVDTNQDGVISLSELVDAQARILERRRAAEAAIQLEKKKRMIEAEAIEEAKAKNKQATNAPKKKSL